MAKRSSKRKRKERKLSGETVDRPTRPRTVVRDIRPRNHAVVDLHDSDDAFANFHFNVTWEPFADPALDNAPEATQIRVSELHQRLQEDCDLGEAIEELHELIEELPDHLPLQNWLINVYESTGEEKLARKMAEDLLEKHPDYFFARTKMANMCMEGLLNLDLERAEELLGGKFKIPQSIAPDRDVFHVTEVTTYFLAVARFFCFKADRDSVEIYRDMIVRVGGEDCAEVEIIDHMLKPQSWMIFEMFAGGSRLTDEAA